MFIGMECVSVYKCLGDEARLRVLNLLRSGPLCVCHVQEALQLPQPKVSKQLAYLKRHGLLESRRHNNWTIYEIARGESSLLKTNLAALESVFSAGCFKEDSQRLAKLDTSVACLPEVACCEGDSC